jgi:Tfp pilus assembly protein PilF
MHPDLLNNSRFLKYYQQWQNDPTSIVFAPIAEYFIIYGMIDEAIEICRAGIRTHSDFISGRVVMAKAYLKRGNWDEAEIELKNVLAMMPENAAANKLMADIANLRENEVSDPSFDISEPVGEAPRSYDNETPSINTVTLASIYASQGHHEQAREIFESILKREPENESAMRGLKSLQ